jgi:hypothetical protein
VRLEVTKHKAALRRSSHRPHANGNVLVGGAGVGRQQDLCTLKLAYGVRARWTLELLADELVRLTEPPSISRETVRRRLAENQLKPWRQYMWCIPQADSEYVTRMEDVLDLYAEAHDPKDRRSALMKAPHGTVNLFVFLDAHRPWRKVKVTGSRTAVDFAACMRDLIDVHDPRAERIRVVLDNLSTHSAGALYDAFPACEARRVLDRLEFHYVPKHASWLNVVEIEIGVPRHASTAGSAPASASNPKSSVGNDGEMLHAPVSNGCSPSTMARTKMGRAYPCQADIWRPKLKESQSLCTGTSLAMSTYQ